MSSCDGKRGEKCLKKVLHTIQTRVSRREEAIEEVTKEANEGATKVATKATTMTVVKEATRGVAPEANGKITRIRGTIGAMAMEASPIRW